MSDTTCPDPAPAPAPAPAGATKGSAAAPKAAGASKWKTARRVLPMVEASLAFQTLRDMVPDECEIEASRLSAQAALGQGGFADVEKALMDGGRAVAVKALRPELLADEEEAGAFLKETRLMRRLRHAHIVQFIGVDSAAGRIRVVQELCAGGSLRDLVYAQMCTPLKQLYTQADALRWGLGLARALAYLHTRRPKIIHRDVKLDNVLLTSTTPSKAVAKLADFGLAKLLATGEGEGAVQVKIASLMATPQSEWDESQRRRSLKVSASIKRSASGRMASGDLDALLRARDATATAHDQTGQAGSYGTMAPEVLRSEPYDERADVFSFGVVLYSLFYRVIPSVMVEIAGREDLAMYAWQVANGHRPELKPAVAPPEVNAVIEACWKGLPSLRPTAVQVVHMLQDVQEKGVCGSAPSSGSQGCGCTCM